MGEVISIDIINWDRFQQHRKDVARPHWFRLENGMWRDEQFFRFSAEERWTWVCLLSYASEKMCRELQLDIDWFCQQSGVSKKTLYSSLDKLSSNGCVTYALRERHAGDTLHNKTLQDITIQDRTIQDTHTSTRVDDPASHPLSDLWNRRCGALPKVVNLTPERRKKAESLWRSKPQEGYWEDVVGKIRDSAFCNGASESGWRATFDFLLRPATHVKAVEGNYDGVRVRKMTHAEVVSQSNAELFAKLSREEKDGGH